MQLLHPVGRYLLHCRVRERLDVDPIVADLFLCFLTAVVGLENDVRLGEH
jgi:hypothetical protein